MKRNHRKNRVWLCVLLIVALMAPMLSVAFAEEQSAPTEIVEEEFDLEELLEAAETEEEEADDYDDEEDYDGDEDFQKRLDYASSTIYYSVLGVFAGGGYSEQVGDVRASRGGYTITMADRARFKSMGDALRLKWGFEVEEDDSSSEMYDVSTLRYEVH